jgi:hypothetical protein
VPLLTHAHIIQTTPLHGGSFTDKERKNRAESILTRLPHECLKLGHFDQRGGRIRTCWRPRAGARPRWRSKRSRPSPISGRSGLSADPC